MDQLNRDSASDQWNEVLEGFRLYRFEVYNWGTFRDHVWRITPAGGTSLLTGRNGSGKTTLADGLLTLLVPFQRRTYNQASGAEKKERNERTYVRGAWSRQKTGEREAATIQYLRGKGDYSVLLAHFRNAPLAQDVTLAQVLWYQDDGVHKLCIAAPLSLSIEEDFRMSGTMTQLRKQFKARKIEAHEDFSRYSQQFRQLVGLRSEKALDLFNLLVSSKEIGELNAFVRDHMLEKTNAESQLTELLANFENLTRAHETMLRAQEQLDILKPLIEEVDQFADRHVRQRFTVLCESLLPIYMAHHKKRLLEDAIETAQQERDLQVHRRSMLQNRLDALLQELLQLHVAIENDHIGRLLEQRELECKMLETRLQEKQGQATIYTRLTQAVGLPAYENEEAFYKTAQCVRMLLEETREHLALLQQQRDERKEEETRLKGICKALSEELQSLQGRTSQIPLPEIHLRQQLAGALQIPEEDVPFVGELLRVRETASEWEGAIERLLHGFGLRLLVPEHHYQQVSHYVERTHLGRRLVYHRMRSSRIPHRSRQLENNMLFTKVEVKPSTPFTDWLTGEIMDAFDYQCCETLEEFRYAHRALTMNGQIKHDVSRHEKDDRKDLANRTNYVLGWTNKEKYQALAEEHTKQARALQHVTAGVQQIEREQMLEDRRRETFQQLLNFETFAMVDWQSDQVRISEVREQQRRLRASANHLADLEHQRDAVTASRVEVQQELDDVNSLITTLTNAKSDYQQQQNACLNLLQGTSLPEHVDVVARIEKDLQGSEITLETITMVQEERRRAYGASASSLQSLQEKLRESIVRRMMAFKEHSPTFSQEADASLEAVDEYRRLYERIRRDDLPSNQTRFKELLNAKVTLSIGLFKAGLNREEGEIKERIARLNEQLRAINYTPTTYIQLCHEPTPDAEVQFFQQALRACVPDTGQPEDDPVVNEVSFQRIAALIERFKSQERWTKKVLDVRNWLDFAAEERYWEGNTHKQWYSDSAGMSGGQKTKLAYTILASAIAYQYGLDQAKGQQRSFRFMTVDEAFCRSDEENAQYAMDLFQQLGLQVLVVTPLDKLHVIEPYIAACHYVTNNEQGNDSKVYDLAFDDYYAGKYMRTDGRERP